MDAGLLKLGDAVLLREEPLEEGDLNGEPSGVVGE
jgi:hypothetical protein